MNLEGTEDIERIREGLKKISDERLVAWVRYSLGSQSDELVKRIKASYLSGQRVNVITGELRHSVAAWAQKSKKNRGNNPTYFVRPGVIGLDGKKPIDGMLNYVGRWTGTKHEFMRPAFEAFGGELVVKWRVQSNLINQFKKVEGEL